MKYRKFSDLGWNVSEVGLGCWQIGGSWGDVSDRHAKQIIKAIKIIRTIKEKTNLISISLNALLNSFVK